ncbi:hypothetical protein B296_00037746 [Ensete ventricosum]|uniref:RING-type domain-containing protein n=1 Tax=Ensete ventricosum TaxID=4639 RepID=A0A426ZKH4_ENSVE|nr:hypothetical protein B296_00037746 [Ensete ventricosum]
MHVSKTRTLLLFRRDDINGVEDPSGIYDMQLGFVPAASGVNAGSFLPLCNASAVMTATSESGLTFNNHPVAMASRKRRRDADGALSFLGEDMSSHFQQQMLDVDRLVVHHVFSSSCAFYICMHRELEFPYGLINGGDIWQAEQVRVELMERLKRFLRRILAAVEEGLSKRLKTKEEEIERRSKLNWALEERIKSLCVENQMWRELARSNEAAAQVLRTNLEQALAAAQVKAERDAAAIAVDDADSCCCGDNADDENRGSAAVKGKKLQWSRLCRFCQEREPSVLLLPCRHLCVCAACGPAVVACPTCNCDTNGTVIVNMS